MCLGSLLKMNHLLIEPLLPDIWSLLVRLPKQLVENGKVRELGGGTEGKFFDFIFYSLLQIFLTLLHHFMVNYVR